MSKPDQISELVERLRYADANSQQRALGSGIFEEAADTITDLLADRDALAKAIDPDDNRPALMARIIMRSIENKTEADDLRSRLLAAEKARDEMADHLETAVELLDIIKEHWIDYDHVYSIAVHESREALSKIQGKP